MAPAAALADGSRPHNPHMPSSQRFQGLAATSNGLAAGVTLPQVSPQLVQASCTKCGAPLGALLNSWVPVTNTYYLQSQTAYRATGLEVKGDPKPPGNADSALSGCLIQALMCSTHACREVLAFTCFRAPDSKAGFRGRQFFKLSKIILTSLATKKVVEPITERPPHTGAAPPAIEAKLSHQQPQLIDVTHADPPSPGADTTMEEFTDADRAAVQGTNDGSMTWKEAHEDWSLKTQRTMSPGAFGKRILNFGGGLKPKPAGPPPNERPQQASHMQNGFAPSRNSLQQVQIAQPRPVQQPPQPQPTVPMQPYRNGPVQQSNVAAVGVQQHDILEQQRRDIDRIDVAVGQLQISIELLNRSVEGVKQEMQKRPATAPAAEDQSAFELLSETVSNMATKTGEVDGLKIQMEAIKRRIKRLEENNGVSSVPSSQQAGAQPGHMNMPQNYESPFAGHTGLNSNNKRPAIPQFAETPGQAYKRARLSDADIQIESARSTPTTTYPPGVYLGADGDTSDNWLPQTQGPRGGVTPSRRGPGRPRKYPTPDTGTPMHDREHWTPQMDVEGYYQALAPAPSTDDRGRIIRRGSLGGSIHMSGKRTRQRPVRNSEGVLIRKDGKPDQRSISSAQNLKKFYNKKIAQLEMEKSIGGDGAEYVGDANTHSPDESRNSQDPMVVDVDFDTDNGSNGISGGGDARATKPDAGRTKPQHNQAHTDIMKKMFPNGIAGEATRLDQVAAELFEPAKSQVAPLSRMQPREDIVKREVVDETPALKDAINATTKSSVENTAAAVANAASNAATSNGVPTTTTTDKSTPSTIDPPQQTPSVDGSILPTEVVGLMQATAAGAAMANMMMMKRIIPDSQQTTQQSVSAVDSGVGSEVEEADVETADAERAEVMWGAQAG